MAVAVCSDLHDYILLQNLNRRILRFGLIPKMKQLYIIAIEKINRLESVPVFFFFSVQRIWTILTIICLQEPQSKANVTNEPVQKKKSVKFILGSHRNSISNFRSRAT